MSADNWGDCPRCRYRAETNGAEFEGGTLREDYEQGMIGDEYSVDYGCRCKTCGFSFSFAHAVRAFSAPVKS